MLAELLTVNIPQHYRRLVPQLEPIQLTEDVLDSGVDMAGGGTGTKSVQGAGFGTARIAGKEPFPPGVHPGSSPSCYKIVTRSVATVGYNGTG